MGEQDGRLPPSMGDTLVAAVPGAAHRTIPGAGHFRPEDRPRKTTAALTAFLTR